LSDPGQGSGQGGGPELRTERLVLRRWRPPDREALARINSDPVVMEFFPGLQSPQLTAEMIEHFERSFERDGFGLWAVEIPGELSLAGFVGLNRVGPPLPFSPAVEVAWRLTPRAWGRGIAKEAAEAALEFGFSRCGLAEIVAYTAAGNLRSRRLMERLGMSRDRAGDFGHPQIAEGHPLKRHVLYRLRAPGASTGGAAA
jgi:RimJ/RimL family protein N-acetyltransferase